MDLAIAISALLIGGLRVTVPGHGLSLKGTCRAMLMIAIGNSFWLMWVMVYTNPFMLAVAVTVSVLAGYLYKSIAGFESWPELYEDIAHLWVGFMIALIILPEYRISAVVWLGVVTIFETIEFFNRDKAEIGK